ncbi:MAG TPA: hypothetical protein VNO17_09365, partial [Actinomycetota bacterium]|nr:hypothetical protein [Actinomycetota bacterium]
MPGGSVGEERPTESHEQVVDTLLDLQRRLRGERDPEPEARAPAAPPTRARAGLAERPSLPPDGVEVRAADDLRVAAAPRDEPGPAA